MPISSSRGRLHRAGQNHRLHHRHRQRGLQLVARTALVLLVGALVLPTIARAQRNEQTNSSVYFTATPYQSNSNVPHGEQQNEDKQNELDQNQNITRLLIERFSSLFNPNELLQFEQQDSLFRGQLLLDRLTLQSNLSELQGQLEVQQEILNKKSQQQQQQQEQQSSLLETRTLSLIQSNLQKLTSINLSELNQAQQRRNYIRVLNRVFSRAELPDSFTQARPFQRTGGLSRSSTSGGGAAGSTSPTSGAHCANHIGCIAELPNFPMILKLKPNVSASFTVYTRERGHKNGQRILFEPLMHYQLKESVEQTTMNELVLQREVLNITKQLKLLPVANPAGSGGGVAGTLAGQGHHRNHHHHHKRRNPLGGHGGPAGAAVAASKQQASKLLSNMATSWISANKIAQAKELPFDLAALEQSNFNASLTTRVIIGGYFAKEDEEWIEELIKQWLLLEPSNVIKVSWQDSNRGLYHSAAYNSRIVGRQLSLFLHYLNELFHIDLNKFHLVGHSLGAHIAGFVGADNDGQIARITGLDPAGPIFVELPEPHRLDSSDANFVDVVHTNGGTITKGALGLSTPSGHVDYYSNGGSLQPGCFFSSVTMSIMDPVERIACNHRRSYRYFTEIIKLAISEQRKLARRNTMAVPAEVGPALQSDVVAYLAMNTPNELQIHASEPADSKKFPHAFLFEAKQEDLVKLVQPELKLPHLLEHSSGSSGAEAGPPLKKQIEFHLLNPEFPREKRGLYFFKTRQEAPFFASKQYALRLVLEQPIKRKITLMVKINSTLVTEVELDEASELAHSFVFVPANPNLIDHAQLFSGRSNKAPDLWLMWRQRSFNMLLAHQTSELFVSSLELLLLDESEADVDKNSAELDGDLPQADQPARNNSARLTRHQLGLNDYLIRYELNSLNQQAQSQTQSLLQPQNQQAQQQQASQRAESSSRTQQAIPSGNSFVIIRNQWHKFDGKPVAIE